MKQLAIALVLSATFIVSHAQEGNNVCAWNAMESYNGGGGPKDLEGGIKCTDEAINNETTKVKSKTWFYRGELYTLVFIDTVLNKKYGTSCFEAVNAFYHLMEMDDKKFKDWDDVTKYLYPLGTNCFNTGVELYQTHNYAQAYQYFIAIKKVDSVLEFRKKIPNIDLATALKNAALMAESSGNMKDALGAYRDWIDISQVTFARIGPPPAKNPKDSVELVQIAQAYQRYGMALKKSGDTAGSKKIIDEGLAKFPKDASLLVEKINFFLADTQYTRALAYINNLLEVEPKNDGAMFIKGLAYDKIGNEDSVVYYYSKAIEINPKSTNSYINLAAVYVNKARVILESMNKLGNSTAETQKYNEMKKQCKELYAKAKPYLEKEKLYRQTMHRSTGL